MKSLSLKNTSPSNPQQYLTNKKINTVIFIVSMILATWFCSYQLGFDIMQVIEKLPNATARFVDLYFPPNLTELDKVLEAIFVTVLLAITASTIGVILAYLSALGTSKTTGRIPGLRFILRFFASLMRNIPSSIWAIILLMAFWFGEFLALLVMTIGTYGFNARVYSDMIDEMEHESIEALEASGASYWQIIAQAIIPETLPTAISWTLYSVENNIRSATIIGILAGGGIGHLIGIYKHYRRFELLTTAVIAVVITVIAVDQLSSYIRKRIL